jgi:hypothetical protein
MITARCLTLSLSYRGPRYPLLSSCRIVVVLTVLALAMILAVQGYPPGEITGPLVVLVAGTVAATDRLVGRTRTRPVSALAAL